MKINLNEIEIAKTKSHELDEILRIQKEAYKKEAERYNDYSIPPLLQTIEEMKAEFEKSLFLTAVYKSAIAGSVRARVAGNCCMIGRLMVAPQFQRNGIGRKLLKTIETEMVWYYPELQRFELFTGEKSYDNIRLYESEGYSPFKYEPFDKDKRILYLEKKINESCLKDFPVFMKEQINRIGEHKHYTEDIEGFFYGSGGNNQMAYWTCYKDRISNEHVHDFDEYMIVAQGQYTVYMNGKHFILKPGNELFIPKETPHSGEVIAGTRTIHCFGGKRI